MSAVPVSKNCLYIFGNWKMAQSFEDLKVFFKDWTLSPQGSVYVAVFPSALHLLPAHDRARASSLIMGAQDCSSEKSGAFTGEISAAQLREMGVDSVLVGHSERRQRFQESAVDLRAKVERALENDVRPVFCLGESLAERESHRWRDVLKSQAEVIRDLSSEVLCAYEPVWAIGTGRVASVEQIEEAHSLLAGILSETPLLYGGSVKPENAEEILRLSAVQGLLVGGASLKAASFSSIAEAAHRQLGNSPGNSEKRSV